MLERIVRDEADHGTFGFAYFDWVAPHLSDADRAALSVTAKNAIAGVHTLWEDVKTRIDGPSDQLHALGWLGTEEYLALAARSLQKQVQAPLQSRGLA